MASKNAILKEAVEGWLKMEKIIFIVMAKSYKQGGRCIAGKLAVFGQNNTVQVGSWVRPVPNDGTGRGALTRQMYCYEDGSEVKVLDIVEVSKLCSIEVPGQPENFVVDESKSWKKIGSLRADTVPDIVDPIENIWLENDVSTNIVTSKFDQHNGVSQSLCLIRPTSLLITLCREYSGYEARYKKKIYASFDYLGVRYENFSVTCPSARRILSNQYPNEGESAIIMPLRKGDDYVLCLSLSPRFGDLQYHYKLVATVFDFDGYLQGTYQA